MIHVINKTDKVRREYLANSMVLSVSFLLINYGKAACSDMASVTVKCICDDK